MLEAIPAQRQRRDLARSFPDLAPLLVCLVALGLSPGGHSRAQEVAISRLSGSPVANLDPGDLPLAVAGSGEEDGIWLLVDSTPQAVPGNVGPPLLRRRLLQLAPAQGGKDASPWGEVAVLSDRACGLAADASGVYWLEGGSLFWIPRDRGLSARVPRELVRGLEPLFSPESTGLATGGAFEAAAGAGGIELRWARERSLPDAGPVLEGRTVQGKLLWRLARAPVRLDLWPPLVPGPAPGGELGPSLRPGPGWTTLGALCSPGNECLLEASPGRRLLLGGVGPDGAITAVEGPPRGDSEGPLTVVRSPGVQELAAPGSVQEDPFSGPPIDAASRMIDAAFVRLRTISEAAPLGDREALWIGRLGEPALNEALEAVWGKVAPAPTGELRRRLEELLIGLDVSTAATPRLLELGRAVFEARCARCHRFEGRGKAVGPDLESVAGRDPTWLLRNVLLPNETVRKEHVSVGALLDDGRFLQGLIVRDTGGRLVLRRDEGLEETVERAHLKRLIPSGVSLMPEGLLNDLKHEELLGLLAHLAGTTPLVVAGAGREEAGDGAPGDRPFEIVAQAGGVFQPGQLGLTAPGDVGWLHLELRAPRDMSSTLHVVSPDEVALEIDGRRLLSKPALLRAGATEAAATLQLQGGRPARLRVRVEWSGLSGGVKLWLAARPGQVLVGREGAFPAPEERSSGNPGSPGG